MSQIIDAAGVVFDELNRKIKAAPDDVKITGVLGQRFIAAGRESGEVVVDGIPGNALGAYLDGADITVNGNVQDAVGDTMNNGFIKVRGNAGDAVGYAMRGGKIYIEGSAGYRAGIHMKEYRDKKPVIVIGKTAGSFLGEYLAGGLIIVLNLDDATTPVGNFTGTGMHGGKIFLRCGSIPAALPEQVGVRRADQEDIDAAQAVFDEFGDIFGARKKYAPDEIFVLEPNTKNPYKRLYTVF